MAGSDVEKRLAEAYLLNEQMRWQDALKLWDGVIDDLPEGDRPQAMMAKALALGGAGRVDDALALAARAATDAPALAPIQIGLLVDLKRPEEAVRVATALGGHDPRVLTHLARGRLATGDAEGAADAAAHAWAGGQDRAAEVLGVAWAALGPQGAVAWAHRASTWLQVGAAGVAAVRALADAGRVDDARLIGRAVAGVGAAHDLAAAWVPDALASHAAGDFDGMYRACGEIFGRGVLGADTAQILMGLRHPWVVKAALIMAERWVNHGSDDAAEALIGFAIDAALAIGPPPDDLLGLGWWQFAALIERRGLHEKAAQANRKASEYYAAAGDPVAAGRSLLAEARTWRSGGRFDEVDDALRRADAAFPPSPSIDRFYLALETADAALARGDRATAEGALATARATADAISLDDAARADLAGVTAKLAGG